MLIMGDAFVKTAPAPSQSAWKNEAAMKKPEGDVTHWDLLTPTDIMADVNMLLAATFRQQPPDAILLSHRTYRWLVRGKIVAMLSKRKHNNRPKFANAMRHS